ncbi:MAG: hypothetical protein ACR2PZ_01980 [Pseudomonadales bacterium]
MSIADLGALGEFVASFGVIATLIYLAIQMRRNTQAVRLNTAQVVTEELQQMFSLLASDTSLAEVFLEAGRSEQLDDIPRVRYYALTGHVLRLCENAYLQHRESAMSEAHWEGIRNMMVDYTKMRAFEAFWNERKHWMSQDFQNFLETEIIPLPPKAGVNIPGNYMPKACT